MSLTDKIRGMPTGPDWKPWPGVLCHPNVVKPLHGVVPRLILGKEWWDETREAAQRATGYHCIACGVYKKDARERPFLEGHEVYRTDYRRGRQKYLRTVPLCHYCHCYVHDGRLRALVDKSEVTREKFDAVMTHGAAILKAHGMKKTHYEGPVADWADWRLVLFGKKYPPVYPTYKAWLEAFGYTQDTEPTEE